MVRFDNKEFYPAKIISITFGYKCPQDHQKIIYNLLPKEVNYWQMVDSDQSNTIERQTIDTPQTSLCVAPEELFRLMSKYNFTHLYFYSRELNPKVRNSKECT